MLKNGNYILGKRNILYTMILPVSYMLKLILLKNLFLHITNNKIFPFISHLEFKDNRPVCCSKSLQLITSN